MGEHNNTSGEHKATKPGRVYAAVVPLAGLVTVLAGCFVAWSNANATIGWFAYAPLNSNIFTGNGVALVSQGTQVGLALAVMGLLVLAFWAGHRIGKRSRPENH